MKKITRLSHCLFGGAALVLETCASAQTVDAFDPHPLTYPTSIAVQADGRAIIVGNFLSVGAITRTRVARLNEDGSVDMTFADPNVDSEVKTVAIQPDGKVLIGGGFTQVGGQVRHSLARLNDDGTLDTGFADPALDGAVWAIALQPDGKVLAGGDFAHVGSLVRNYFARFDANGSFDPGFSDPQLCCNVVRAVALQSDGHVLIGGLFTQAGGVNGHDYLARYSSAGVFDPSFPNVPDSIVLFASDIVVTPDGSILLAGTGSPSMRKLKVDGTLDTAFTGASADGSINTIALQPNGKFLIGGTFQTVGGQPRHGLARLDATGSIDPAFADLHVSVTATNLNGYVFGVASQVDGRTLAVGNFSLAGGQSRAFVTRVTTGDAASSALRAQANGASAIVTWTRSGDGPELVQSPALMFSPDGTTFSAITTMTRIAGGWQATVPHDLHGTPFYLQARGVTSTGAGNGSLGQVASAVLFSDTIFADGFD
jgi:uncharacterized delta-60 repeat protein